MTDWLRTQAEHKLEVVRARQQGWREGFDKGYDLGVGNAPILSRQLDDVRDALHKARERIFELEDEVVEARDNARYWAHEVDRLHTTLQQIGLNV